MNEDKINRFPYLVNNWYSLGYWLKDYGYYPKKWPLFTYMDHGVAFGDTVALSEIMNDAPIMFKFSPRLVKVYREKSRKPVYNVLNPSIHYRIKSKIRQSDDAIGSLYFVAHSTPLIDDLTDWELLVADIRKLPDHFYPIDICLHPVDVQKGLGKFFESKNFNVYCADRMDSEGFVENFYDILRRYKYTLSNLIGSYTFYAVEMGIPFSLYGEEPTYFNNGDRNVEKGIFKSYKTGVTYKKAVGLFEGLHMSVTDSQRNFVERELGKYDSISRLKTCYLLYKAGVSYCLKNPRYFFYLRQFLTRQLKLKMGLVKNH